jgi:hypothetical protein
VFDDPRYTDEASDGTTGFLAWSGRIGGQEIEGVDLLHFGPDGKIREFTPHRDRRSAGTRRPPPPTSAGG